HVLPRRHAWHDHRDGVVLMVARHKHLEHARHHRRPDSGRARSGAAGQLRQFGAVGPADGHSLGNRLPEWRPGAAPSKPALRGGHRGARALSRAALPDPQAPEAEDASFRRRRIRLRLRAGAHLRGVLPRARFPDRLPRGRLAHNGHDSVDTDGRRRALGYADGARTKRSGASGAMTRLKEKLVRLIEAAGPMSVADYMALC